MRILDRYILKLTITTFLSCIFLFLFMYVIIDLLSHLEDIIKQQAHISLLFQYYMLYLPIMFVQVAPFACLLSTLYAFGKMNHDNEIIAMRSSGLSVLEITKSVIILGFLVSLFTFWINDQFVPGSVNKTQKIKEQMDKGKKLEKEQKPEFLNNLSMYGERNRLFFVNKFSPKSGIMEGITILEHDEHQNITKKIIANKAEYKDKLWKFYQCIVYNFDKDGQVIQEPQYFEEKIMGIAETPQDFLSQRQRTEFMNITELNDYIWKLSRSGATTVIRNLKIDYYQRFASPFTNMIIILLGIPFALMMKKKSTGLSSIGLSILVGFLYYILDAISIALGKGGMLMPLLSVSLSHIVALLSAFYFINTLP